MALSNLALPWILALAPQNVREPIELSPASLSLGPALASDDEVTAAVWAEVLGEGVLLSVSDGRGLAWSVPVPVDEAPPILWIEDRFVSVVDGEIVIAWSDGRYHELSPPGFVATTPFLRLYDAATGALGPEILIPTGSPVESTEIDLLALDAERVGTALHIHVAMILHAEQADGLDYGEVRLVTSLDGGATFLTPLTVPVPPPMYYPGIAVQAEGGVVHLAWIDDSVQVYYQRSSDGGQTFDFAEAKKLTTGGSHGSLDFDARGSVLAFAASVYSLPHDASDVVAAVSLDGGASFGPPQSVPHADPLTEPPSYPSVAVGSDGAVHLAWQDSRLGVPHVYASRTADGGASWSDDVQVSLAGAVHPELVAAGASRARIVAAWTEMGTAFPMACLSSDGGASWGTPIQLGQPLSIASPHLAFNDRYQNLIAGWADHESPQALTVGGFRPQTLTPAGFTAGAKQVGAAFERFDDGSPLAFLLLSTAPGDLLLPFGDLRNTGLGLTPLLLTSVGLAAGPFAAGLDAAGSGALAPIPAALPAPLTLYALGLSFDPATLSFGDISDVARIDL